MEYARSAMMGVGFTGVFFEKAPFIVCFRSLSRAFFTIVRAEKGNSRAGATFCARQFAALTEPGEANPSQRGYRDVSLIRSALLCSSTCPEKKTLHGSAVFRTTTNRRATSATQ